MTVKSITLFLFFNMIQCFKQTFISPISTQLVYQNDTFGMC